MVVVKGEVNPMELDGVNTSLLLYFHSRHNIASFPTCSPEEVGHAYCAIIIPRIPKKCALIRTHASAISTGLYRGGVNTRFRIFKISSKISDFTYLCFAHAPWKHRRCPVYKGELAQAQLSRLMRMRNIVRFCQRRFPDFTKYYYERFQVNFSKWRTPQIPRSERICKPSSQQNARWLQLYGPRPGCETLQLLNVRFYTLQKVGRPRITLKSEQRECIEHMYEGKDVIVWLPTI